MSRITEMILDPQVTYTGKTFTVRVKVQDDYKYKKYLISENIKYVTATGESFTLTNVNGTQPGSILQITGKSIQNGTPTPDAPVEIQNVSGDNHIIVNGRNNFDGIFELGTINASGQNSTSSSIIRTKNYIDIKPNTPYTLKNPSQITGIALYYYKDNEYLGTSSPSLKQDKSSTFTTRADANQMRWRYNSGYTTTENEVMLLEGTIAMADIPEYEPYAGNKYRIDLGGKNLYDKSQELGGKIINSAGGIGNDSSYNASDFLDITNNTTITLSTNTTSTLMIAEYNSTQTFIKRNIKTNATSYTITTSSTTKKIRICYFATASQVQLEKGSVATEYSLYVTNPIELCGIDGYENIIRKSTGKNQFKYPYTDTTKTVNGITFTDNGDGSITINGTATAQTIFYIKSGLWRYDSNNPIEEGTYSINNISRNGNIFLCLNLYDTNNTSTFIKSSSANTSFTVSTTMSLSNPRIVVNSGQTVNNLTVCPQLELGSVSTEPEPPGTGEWYIFKKIKSFIFDGTQSNPQINTSMTNTTRVTYGAFAPDCQSAYGLLSNRLTQQGNWNNDWEGIQQDGNNGGIWFRINKTTIGTTATEVNAWLNTNPIKAIIPLKIPVYEKITNEDLIEQLNEIQNMQMQDGETNIFWTGEITPTMLLQYANNEELHANIITESGDKIRTDWRSLERRNKWMTK